MYAIRLILLLLTLTLVAGNAHASTDAAQLARLAGLYVGKEKIVVRSPASIRQTDKVQARYWLPNGKGVVRGKLNDHGIRARIIARIRKVKCRGNRVIYTGTSRFRLFGRGLQAQRFRAVATTSRAAREDLSLSASYGGRSPGGYIRLRGTFQGSK